MPSIEEHKNIFARVSELVAADGGFHSNANMKEALEAGVKKLAIPGRRGRSKGKKKKRKERWYTEGLRWRVGERETALSATDGSSQINPAGS